MELKKNPKQQSFNVHRQLTIEPGLTDTLLPKGDGIDNTGYYFKDGLRRVDFVLVYEHSHKDNLKNKHNEERRQYYLEQLRQADMETEEEEIQDHHETLAFVKVHAPFKALCHIADHLKMEMPLKLHDVPLKLPHHCIRDTWYKLFNCYFCSDVGKENAYEDQSVIFYPFNEKEIDLFDVKDREKFFSNTQRTEMVWEILQNTPNNAKNSKSRGIESLVEHKIFEAAYPIHESYLPSFSGKRHPEKKLNTLRQSLHDNWTNWRNIFALQPIHKIRNYFGEKIGFYFLFMDFYTKQLAIPSIAGLITFIVGMTLYWNDEEVEAICDEHSVPGKYWMCPICEPPNCEPWLMSEEGCHKYKWEFALDNEGTVGLSCFVLLWAMLFFKFWKRREATFSTEWKTEKCKLRNEFIRPEYEKAAPEIRRNPETLENEPHIPYFARVIWITLSISATILILCISGACLAGLVLSRIALYGALRKAGGHLAHHNVEYSRWFIHLLIFILVTITAKIYNKLVLKLTSFECPRTQHQFMSSVLWKFFVFEMVNEFLPICYAAWMKGKTVDTPLDLHIMSELCDGGCMAEVVELVFVLLFLRLVVGNALEIGLPMLKNCIKRIQRKDQEKDHNLPQWLKDFYLNEIELDGVYEEYMEMMIQFAFVVLFISAFPLAPILCLINNILEIRLDATKLLLANRRPVPIRVKGIEIWNRFLDIIIKLGVFFNAALIAFTSDIVPRLYYGHNLNELFQNSTRYNHRGFTAYSLSYINVSDFNSHEKLEEFHEKHIDRCYYVGYREPNYPYQHKMDFWRLATIRVTAFALYSLAFFVIMWIINVTIPDEPHQVKVKLARQNNLSKKYFKREQRMLPQKSEALSS